MSLVPGVEHEVQFRLLEMTGHPVVLGMPFLRKVNPYIDWPSGRVYVFGH